jgi:transcriptional regulator with PAS, ATPase and Fis domain|tara:strand:- start:1002 stop:2246 length:1245 start_codon:yes stop_codon:yes gene_type:complete
MNLNIQSIKQRFEIVGSYINLDRAIEKSIRVSPTDISVLITGESGVGKEIFPKIIHQLSHRKHNKFIAVNCGAIPEGTIDSELFGHEKGAFTGASSTRSGYFEVADGGTIFLDEVGELPITTQVRLLRVLENGEFIKVGSSKVQKTDVRIVAATNINMDSAIKKNKFREDLYYRLSTIEINIPPLRKRKNDIVLLFRKFASDFAKKYNMPTVRLDEEAQLLLKKYRWNGNIRQLKNITEQLSVLEQKRAITASILSSYLPNPINNLPALIEKESSNSDFSNEREILYKILFDMKKDLNELKKDIGKIKSDNPNFDISVLKNMQKNDSEELIEKNELKNNLIPIKKNNITSTISDKYDFAEEIQEEETLSIQDKELELVIKSLERNNGRRKAAANELGISERTLYRKIKQYDIKL